MQVWNANVQEIHVQELVPRTLSLILSDQVAHPGSTGPRELPRALGVDG